MAARPEISKWVLSPHAVLRMEERGITLAELTELIEHPDARISQGPKWIFAKAFRGRSDNKIAAVLLERRERNLWVVVTVMVRFAEKA